MRSARMKDSARRGKAVRERAEWLPGLEELPQTDEQRSAQSKDDGLVAVASDRVSATTLDNAFRRYGVEAEDAFLALAARYLQVRAVEQRARTFFPQERGLAALDIVRQDKQVLSLVDRVVEGDPAGLELPVWYQFFLGRRFREGSGKFFTPQSVAAAMARLLPIRPDCVIMDPACGGGTFLTEASKAWQDVTCHLVGNDVDRMLVGLTELRLAISAHQRHSFSLRSSNVFDCQHEFENQWGRIDCILANPPFSLPIEKVGIDSQLFRLGYEKSDAVFLDVCHALLVPGGSLVCLLPHSIIVNSEYRKLRIAVEKQWDLCGVITLPEGVFYLTANTSTRADIIHLRKKGGQSQLPQQTYFANAPSVGIPLNSRSSNSGENALDTIVNDPRVRGCVASCA